MKKLAKKLMASVLGLFGDRRDYRPPRCGNIRTLLLHLCDMDEQLCLWVLRWLAYPLRNPGAKMETAIVINGSDGTGTSLFFVQVAARLHGTAGRVIVDYELDGLFNYWAPGAQFVVVEGTFKKRQAVRLKQFVTAKWLVVEGRDKAAALQENETNFVFLSGALDFLPEDCNDRRFVIVEAPPRRDNAFYQAVRHEINEGGITAFHEYLVRDLDMGTFNPNTLPPAQRQHKEAA